MRDDYQFDAEIYTQGNIVERRINESEAIVQWHPLRETHDVIADHGGPTVPDLVPQSCSVIYEAGLV